MGTSPPSRETAPRGIPVTADGQIIGGVGVGGASSPAQDEELAIAGAEAAKSFGSADAMSAGMLPVSFFAKKEVDEGFAKGSVLFDGSGGRNYMVHASRREGPGMGAAVSAPEPAAARATCTLKSESRRAMVAGVT